MRLREEPLVLWREFESGPVSLRLARDRHVRKGLFRR